LACSSGLEPINFNTGNYFMKSLDYHLSDIGDIGLTILRTYNAQSDKEYGLFGAQWSFAYDQFVKLYAGGEIGYRAADGALTMFTPAEDGGFACETPWLSLCISEKEDGAREYTVSEKDGTCYVFNSDGLITRIVHPGGRETHVTYDKKHLMTAITLPSGTKVSVRMDTHRRITSLITPSGMELSYGYDAAGNLARFTDGNGGVTRYMYDNKGRMTEWYDELGMRQVYNEYDNQDRAHYQEDALGGSYTLACPLYDQIVVPPFGFVADVLLFSSSQVYVHTAPEGVVSMSLLPRPSYV